MLAWKQTDGEEKVKQVFEDRKETITEAQIKKALEYLVDPIHGSPSHNRRVVAVITIHVDDTLMSGEEWALDYIQENLAKDFVIGSVDVNDAMFVGQRVRWVYEETK